MLVSKSKSERRLCHRQPLYKGCSYRLRDYFICRLAEERLKSFYKLPHRKRACLCLTLSFFWSSFSTLLALTSEVSISCPVFATTIFVFITASSMFLPSVRVLRSPLALRGSGRSFPALDALLPRLMRSSTCANPLPRLFSKRLLRQVTSISSAGSRCAMRV